MSNEEFESANLIRKRKKMESHHVYYIDELNGHLYIADRVFKIDKYREVVTIDENELIIIEDFGDLTTRQMKGFINKEYALKILENIQKATP